MNFDQSQIAAIQAAIKNPLTVITGGAGSGKTTIINEVANALQMKGENPSLCAFAGKAAARLKEATGREATTIHRMLGYNGMVFMTRDLKEFSVIVDESSMVSADIMAEIIKREPKRLILVGDAAQLPPVGKGQPFHDIINIRPDIVNTLTTCYRNKEAVFKAATAIRNGEEPLSHDKTDGERWDIMHTGNSAKTSQKIIEWVRSGFIDFDTDIILTPRNGDNAEQAATVKHLNREIVQIVNPHDDEEKRLDINDRVINTKNYPEFDIWNGTTGKIHAINESGQITLRLDFDIVDKKRTINPSEPFYTDLVTIDKEMNKSLQHAYALTVHKAQGSQYKRVIFVALERDCMTLLDRSLIYTAITRTQEQCVVVGQTSALRRGITTVNEKRTVLQELALA